MSLNRILFMRCRQKVMISSALNVFLTSPHLLAKILNKVAKLIKVTKSASNLKLIERAGAYVVDEK